VGTIVKRGRHFRAQIRRQGFPGQSATFHTRLQAETWLRSRESELAGMRYGMPPQRTVRQAIERYANEVSPTHRGAKWELIRLGKLGRQLEFADRWLDQVQGHDIASWRDDALSRLASASVRREYGLLRAVFASAVKEWGWLRVTPFATVRAPPAGKPRSQRISDEEATAICDALGFDGTPPETAGQFAAAAFLWCLATAMRQGEALTLERAAIAGKVAHLDKTKNGDERDVPLRPAALALLKLLPTEGYLFPIASGTCDTLFRRSRDALELRHIRFHDSRREATTRLAAQVDVLTLAKLTGHRDVKTLLTTYYRPSMDDVAEGLD
jgi:integrase